METQWKVTPQALTELVDLNPDMSSYKLLILNNPGNPSGTVYTAEELKALAVICRQKQIIVLSDEIYSLLNFNGNHSSLLDFYPEGTLVTSGFSKWSSAGGWRIGYIIIPKELNTMNRILQSAASQTYSCAPAPMQYAIAQVIAPLIFWGRIYCAFYFVLRDYVHKLMNWKTMYKWNEKFSKPLEIIVPGNQKEG